MRPDKAFAQQLINLEARFDEVQSAFNTLEESRLNHLWREARANLEQVTNVLGLLVKHQRCRDVHVAANLKQRAAALVLIDDALTSESEAMRRQLKADLLAVRPSNFPKPVRLPRVQDASKHRDPHTNVVYSGASEAAVLLESKTRLDEGVGRVWARARAVLTTAWAAAGETYVARWRKLLSAQSQQLGLMANMLARDLAPGVVRDVMVTSGDLEIPISVASCYMHEGNSITKVVVHPAGDVTVETTAGVATGDPETLLPASLRRMIKTSLKVVGVSRSQGLSKQLSDESIEKELANEALLHKERTTGYNPKVTQLVKLMFETALPEEETVDDRFVTPDNIDDPEVDTPCEVEVVTEN